MNETVYNKILKALELVCPLFKENLIEKAYIVGSVAKGTAREESDIDIYLINSLFEAGNVQTLPDEEYPNIRKLVNYLKNNGVKFEKLEIKGKQTFGFYFQIYKDEIFHLMYDYEPNTITGNYIEIAKDFCDIIKIKR